MLVSGLLGAAMRPDRAGNAADSKKACYRKRDTLHLPNPLTPQIHTHTHTHRHAQTSGFSARDRVQEETACFRYFIALSPNLILRNHSVPISPPFRNSIYPSISNFCRPSIASIRFSSSTFVHLFPVQLYC